MLDSEPQMKRMRLEIAEIERAFEYIAGKFRNAQWKIEHAAFSPEIVGFAQYSAPYREAVGALIGQNQVFYRYVAGVGPDTERKGHRLHGIRKHLEHLATRADGDSRYSAKVVFTDAEFNGVNFFLFDERELAIYVPGMEGESGVGLFTRDPSDVKAYQRNFSGLWHKARNVGSVDDAEHIQSQLADFRPALAPRLRKELQTSFGGELETVLDMCRRLPETARVLANRSRKGKPPFEIADEYDVQDLLHATIRSRLKYSVLEDPIPKVAATQSGRADISIEEVGVLIEIKFAREPSDQKTILKQYSEDLVLYARWPHLKTLIFLIYNSHKLSDPDAFLKLTGPHEFPGIHFDVEVVLA